MNTLHIFYDEHCGLCSRFRRWIETQASYVALDFVPYDSPRARALLPGIASMRADEEIVVLGDEGSVWQGGPAWVTCLWALVDYREWSLTLADTVPATALRKIVHWVSGNRIRLSQLLGLKPDQLIRESTAVVCEDGSCKLPPPLPRDWLE